MWVHKEITRNILYWLAVSKASRGRPGYIIILVTVVYEVAELPLATPKSANSKANSDYIRLSRWLFLVYGSLQFYTESLPCHGVLIRKLVPTPAFPYCPKKTKWLLVWHGVHWNFYSLWFWWCCTPGSCTPCGSSAYAVMANSHISSRYDYKPFIECCD